MQGVESSCDAPSVFFSIDSFEREDCKHGTEFVRAKWYSECRNDRSFKKGCWRFRQVLTPRSAKMDLEHSGYVSCSIAEGNSMLRNAYSCERVSTTGTSTLYLRLIFEARCPRSRQGGSGRAPSSPCKVTETAVGKLNKGTVMEALLSREGVTDRRTQRLPASA